MQCHCVARRPARVRHAAQKLLSFQIRTLLPLTLRRISVYNADTHRASTSYSSHGEACGETASEGAAHARETPRAAHRASTRRRGGTGPPLSPACRNARNLMRGMSDPDPRRSIARTCHRLRACHRHDGLFDRRDHGPCGGFAGSLRNRARHPRRMRLRRAARRGPRRRPTAHAGM